jgi:hypothetical protein
LLDQTRFWWVPFTLSKSYVNTIAIDPALWGDWLAPEPANYIAVRDAQKNRNHPACVYDYIGGGFLGQRADTAWDDLVSQNIRYLVTIDPNVHKIPANTYNGALDKQRFPLLWSHLTGTSLFQAEPPIPEYPGVMIFRRVDGRIP